MTITVTGADALRTAAKDIRAIPAASQRAATRAVNAVSAKLVTQALRDIRQQINLPRSYLNQHTTRTKATHKNPTAAIRMRMRAVRLARFGAKQLTARAKHRHRVKGDPSRGIPAGRKQAGVSVAVVRGKRKRMRGAFLIPLSGGNGLGVFVRTGRGPKAIQHKYGPSPHQLFRRWIAQSAPDIQQQLADAYHAQLRYELTGQRK